MKTYTTHTKYFFVLMTRFQVNFEGSFSILTTYNKEMPTAMLDILWPRV